MPYLNIQTNRKIPDDTAVQMATRASSKVADLLGKPERYVMVNVSGGATLLFAGTHESAAYVELKSIGLPENQTQHLSEALCTFLHKELDIDPARIYVEFIDIPRKFWGWNNSTF